VGHHEEKCLLNRTLVDDDASCSRDSYGRNTEDDIDEVHPDTGAKQNDTEAAEEASSEDGVSLIQLGLLRARG
jgi:hypothetical protein